ncbi:hypothetical protein [Frankia sp. Cj3]|uniref:hypothetical protein n=1 Tax=Frankia sp. Cj3 TaxID=2880976 RepID=UPI001EF58E16|nr:hypothetical protein [Frankia sp. Cj3]
MSKDFKKLRAEALAAEPRARIPQVDVEASKPTLTEPVAPTQPTAARAPVEAVQHDTTAAEPKMASSSERPVYITPVDTSEQPTNRGFAMYPSRHTQVVRDLTFIEGRRPWLIIEDALEEYVVKHYGKEYRRR